MKPSDSNNKSYVSIDQIAFGVALGNLISGVIIALVYTLVRHL